MMDPKDVDAAAARLRDKIGIDAFKSIFREVLREEIFVGLEDPTQPVARTGGSRTTRLGAALVSGVSLSGSSAAGPVDQGIGRYARSSRSANRLASIAANAGNLSAASTENQSFAKPVDDSTGETSMGDAAANKVSTDSAVGDAAAATGPAADDAATTDPVVGDAAATTGPAVGDAAATDPVVGDAAAATGPVVGDAAAATGPVVGDAAAVVATGPAVGDAAAVVATQTFIAVRPLPAAAECQSPRKKKSEKKSKKKSKKPKTKSKKKSKRPESPEPEPDPNLNPDSTSTKSSKPGSGSASDPDSAVAPTASAASETSSYLSPKEIIDVLYEILETYYDDPSEITPGNIMNLLTHVMVMVEAHPGLSTPVKKEVTVRLIDQITKPIPEGNANYKILRDFVELMLPSTVDMFMAVSRGEFSKLSAPVPPAMPDTPTDKGLTPDPAISLGAAVDSHRSFGEKIKRFAGRK